MPDSNNTNQTLKSDLPQKDKNQNKFLIPLAVILVGILIGLLVYIVYTYIEYKNKISARLNNSETNNTTSNDSNAITTSTNSSETPEPFEGWKTYTSNELSIKFKYNYKFSNIQFFPSDELNKMSLVIGPETNISIDILDIRNVDTSSQEYQDKFSYMILNTENLKKKVIIEDKEYTFIEYTSSEGVANRTYPSCMDTYDTAYYYVEVDNKIVVAINTQFGEICVSENKTEKYTYSESDFENALEIISSIEFI